MHEPIKVKDLIRMLERENQESYVHIATSSIADVNDEDIKYKKFASDISIAIRDNGIYLLATHI